MNKLTRIMVLTGLTFCAGLEPVLAATDTLDVTATIQQTVSVVITSNDNAFAVTAGSAISDQDIATIAIDSNDPDGYAVTLAGSHDGSTLDNVAGDETLAYTVSYASAGGIGLTTAPTSVEDVVTQTAGSETRSLTLSIAGSESIGKSAEAFTDTITVEIVGK
jgi:hypothetical protein